MNKISNAIEEAGVLKLTIHGHHIGWLAGYRGGRNVLSFSNDFRFDPARPTFSLLTHPSQQNADRLMAAPWVRHQRLHPTLSNMLPEGALRELTAQSLKVHIDNEFSIFASLGYDLPGALVATPMNPEEVPPGALLPQGKARAIRIERTSSENQFSLAGVQMKFSMKEKDGRYNIAQSGELGDWIIKTPSSKHAFVPLNEFTAMSLAALVGVEIPTIKLVDTSTLENLPPINLPAEKWAFAIKRYDRNTGLRIHAEDFAQVLMVYPHNKYDSANYEQLGRVVYECSGEGLADVQQLARRLLVNILLGNGDAHLKNWSLIYPDQITPRLSPAYDIVTTNVYMRSEKRFALNLGKTKEWYTVSLDHFNTWADKVGVPWRTIKPHLHDVMDKARALWPEALQNLPMDESQKVMLREHWALLQADFRIQTTSTPH
jgi:serine/threonine-protein kinase HipA